MTLTIGLVGCGDIGRLRAQAVAKSRVARLHAVADMEMDRASELAAKHRVPAMAVDQLLHSNSVDAIIVSTPPSSHADLTALALNHGKHVLCEKPLAGSVDECRTMVDTAEQSGHLLATGFNYRFYPSVRKAYDLLRAGRIGELDHIRSYAGYSASELTHPWMRDSNVMGGGALRDNGIHLIDLTCLFLGDVQETVGSASNGVWRMDGCEDNGMAVLRNAQGNLASLHASWTEWRGYRFHIDIYGTRGCLRASCFPMYTSALWSEETGGSTHRKRYFFPKTHFWEKVRSYRWVVVQSFIEEIKAFEQAIRNQPSRLATGHDGLRAVMIASQVSTL